MNKFVFVLLTWMLAAGFVSGNADGRLHILVYGATGKVGTHIVDEALNRGHIVTAVSRDPSRIERQHENLTAVEGNLLDPDNVRNLISGKDVVIISVRGVIGDKHDPRNALQFIAAQEMVEALQELGEGGPRYIHVGGAGSLEVKPGVVYAQRLPKLFLSKKLEAEIFGQKLVLDYLRTISDVRWTYATPPKNLTNGRRTGTFRIGGDQLMEDDRGRSRVSRADFAVAVIDEAENGEYVRERFSVAY